METILGGFQQFGVAAVVLAGFMVGSSYVLRRLFAKDDGILTRVGERHLAFLENQETISAQIATSYDRLADAADTAHAGLADRNAKTASLHRAGVHACDVLERVAEALDIDDKAGDSIRAIRRELNGGNR